MADQEAVVKALDAKEAVAPPTIQQTKYPTIPVELPSKGLFYPEGHPLSGGVIEMRFMTAKDEDILTTEAYIRKGVVLDKLFQNLIVTKVNYDEILTVDRDALMLAARAGAYGEIYETKVLAPSGVEVPLEIDLNNVKHLEIDQSLVTPGQNRFEYTTKSGDVIVFKLLTNAEQRAIDESLSKGKRADQADPQLTTRLAHMVQSVKGDTDKVKIKLYIRDMLARDSRLLREHIKKVQPGLDLSVEVIDPQSFQPFRGEINFGLDFFWPDTRV